VCVVASWCLLLKIMFVASGSNAIISRSTSRMLPKYKYDPVPSIGSDSIDQTNEGRSDRIKKHMLLFAVVCVAGFGLITIFHVNNSIDMSLKSQSSSASFDIMGRYIIRNYQDQFPFSSFLPGIGGFWGIPMYVILFYSTIISNMYILCDKVGILHK
jgi:hypothetical protein